MNDNIALLTKEFNAAGVSQFQIQDKEDYFLVYDIQGINACARVCDVIKALGMNYSFMHHYLKDGKAASSMSVR